MFKIPRFPMNRVRVRTRTGAREAARRKRQGWPIEQSLRMRGLDLLRVVARPATWQDPRTTYQSLAYLAAMANDPTYNRRKGA